MSDGALWACLELPALPLDVFARARAPDDTRPFAVGSGGHSPRIVLADAAAHDAGLRAGQLVSAALALAPDLVLRDRDPAAEAAALACVATWIAQFTPMVTLAPPVAVLADIGGSLRLFGGRARLAALLAAGARDLGYTARLAFAPTPAAALAFARAGLVGTATPSTLDAALAPLPLAHFDVDPAARELLAAAGVATFGAAAALPRDGLARRAGPAFMRTLDRARGAIPDPRLPFVPPPRYEGRLELPAAVERTDALAFAVQRLVHELAGWLLGRGLGVTRLSLTLAHERWAIGRDTPAATTVGFALAAPARDVPHLVGVLRERLARLELPAPVVALTLASAEAAPLAGRNLGLLPGEDNAVGVPLIDRLRARLGERAVAWVVPRAEHRPERAHTEAATPASAPAAARPARPARSTARRTPATATTKATHVPATPAPVAPPRPPVPFAPRPLWLLTEPQPLSSLLEKHPWVLRDGPERIESGWWDGGDVRRDYFVAASPTGELAWIYRDHRYGVDDGEWFLHGVFA